MAKSANELADKLTGIAFRQLQQSASFKLPRIQNIRLFRNLYNGKFERRLRTSFHIPIPVFSGMIDTLQADLDDTQLFKYVATDPADYLIAKKANAAVEKESTSPAPGAAWASKFRQLREEVIFTGRGQLSYRAYNAEDDLGKVKYASELEVTPFEDFHFEPKGGGILEKHLFAGRENIWLSKTDLENGVGTTYDKRQVKSLIAYEGGKDYKSAWRIEDEVSRFRALNLNPSGNDYVGEPMFHLVEWVLTWEGKRWYILFDPYLQTWVRFEKLKDIKSDGRFPWMSCASHQDIKNFASKGFSDDLYPVADGILTLFNQDMTNRQKRNSNARAYDKDMFKNPQALYEAQLGQDKLVAADTKGGTRRISEGIYAFETPDMTTGTVDLIEWLQTDTGQNLGVTDLQRGEAQAASKKVGVTYVEQAQINKRLSFESQPFIGIGTELAQAFYCGLKDYLREPMSIKLLGENGFEWSMLKRVELSPKRPMEVDVVSQSAANKKDLQESEKKSEALAQLKDSPNINQRLREEYLLRDAGYSDAEIAMLQDPNNTTTQESIAITSAAIQDLEMGRTPPMNYKADGYFLQRLHDHMSNNRDTPKVKRNWKEFGAYIAQHEIIAVENEARNEIARQRALQNAAMLANPGGMPTQGGAPQPGSQPSAVNPPIIPQPELAKQPI